MDQRASRLAAQAIYLPAGQPVRERKEAPMARFACVECKKKFDSEGAMRMHLRKAARVRLGPRVVSICLSLSPRPVRRCILATTTGLLGGISLSGNPHRSPPRSF